MTEQDGNLEDEIGTLDDLEVEETPTLEAAPEPTDTDDDDDDIPDKYKGKTPKEIIRMHQEAEQALGRQGSEVGQLRASIDQYVQNHRVADTPEPVDEIDFDDDPRGAVKEAVDSNPRIKKLEERLDSQTKAGSLARLEEKHDVKAILTDPDFAQWVAASKMRSRMFANANTKYDEDSADELFTTWTERQGMKQKLVEAETGDRGDAAKKANTGTASGTAGPSKRGKKYYRQDIINLMNDDPKRYARMEPEIRKAYAEKRVINR